MEQTKKLTQAQELIKSIREEKAILIIQRGEINAKINNADNKVTCELMKKQDEYRKALIVLRNAIDEVMAIRNDLIKLSECDYQNNVCEDNPITQKDYDELIVNDKLDEWFNIIDEEIEQNTFYETEKPEYYVE
jgi:hypothetical protein